jgi:hypothetical protein
MQRKIIHVYVLQYLSCVLAVLVVFVAEEYISVDGFCNKILISEINEPEQQ